jgi:hypothetical protein
MPGNNNTRKNGAATANKTRKINVNKVGYYNGKTGKYYKMLNDNPRLSHKVRDFLTTVRFEAKKEQLEPGFIKFIVSLIDEELK